jgi:hypothetical protein
MPNAHVRKANLSHETVPLTLKKQSAEIRVGFPPAAWGEDKRFNFTLKIYMGNKVVITCGKQGRKETFHLFPLQPLTNLFPPTTLTNGKHFSSIPFSILNKRRAIYLFFPAYLTPNGKHCLYLILYESK